MRSKSTRLKFYKVYIKSGLEELTDSPEMVRIKQISEKVDREVFDEGLFRGCCSVCHVMQDFSMTRLRAWNGRLNFREDLTCPQCGLMNRQRAMIELFRQNVQTGSFFRALLLGFSKLTKRLIPKSNAAVIFCYECTTSFYAGLSKVMRGEYEGMTLIGSEFLGFDKKPGEVINNIRHEDALNLSFGNESVDVIISNDVYEHVPDVDLALQEVFRCLRRGGSLIFSIPFHRNNLTTHKRAEIVNGQLVLLQEEIYHGNPVSEKGSLVFYDFGWDILGYCKKAGFRDVYMAVFFDAYYAHLSYAPLHFFVAKK